MSHFIRLGTAFWIKAFFGMAILQGALHDMVRWSRKRQLGIFWENWHTYINPAPWSWAKIIKVLLVNMITFMFTRLVLGIKKYTDLMGPFCDLLLLGLKHPLGLEQ